MPVVTRLILVISSVLLWANIAVADAGVPMIFLGAPFALSVLIPVMAIECLVYSKTLQLSFSQTLKPTIFSNIASTILGYPLSWLLLLGLEFATTGGFAPNISTVLGKIIAVTLQAAWLIPFENELYWMIPVAGLVGLIPAFFLSVLIEKWVLKKFFWKELPELKSAAWKANSYSYLMLVLILLGILFYSLLSRH